MIKQRLKVLTGFSLIILTLTLAWTAAYFLTNLLYDVIHFSPSLLIQQLINSLFGFFLFGCTMFLYALIAKKHQYKREDFFQSIIDAMTQISQGDYNISLKKFSNHHDPNDPFAKIVDTINHMAKELGEMEEMKQEFISNVSHEIQSPLTSIHGFAHAMENSNLSATEKTKYLQIIQSESERLSKLSDNLLKLTYLESKHQQLEIETYQLDTQIKNIILANEPQWLMKQIDVEIDLPKTTIQADRSLLDQVWINLLNNAIKFTPKKGTILLKLLDSEDKLTIYFSDSGMGINQTAQMHLFDRFYKTDKARNRTDDGNGLGLSIVKKIVNLHGGTISVESEPNKGSTFIISFPKQL